MAGSNLFTGILDLLILRALRSGPDHGYGIGAWIREVGGDVLSVEEGVLYPALHRLEGEGLDLVHIGAEARPTGEPSSTRLRQMGVGHCRARRSAGRITPGPSTPSSLRRPGSRGPLP